MRINCYTSFGVIVALILTVIGSITMAICLLISIAKVENIFDKFFFPLYNIIYIRISGCIMAITVIIFSVLIVIFSSCTNKATKSSVYRGDFMCIGGKNSATALLAVNFTAVLIWIIISSFLVIPSIIWLMLSSTCLHELLPGLAFKFIFNLTSFGFYEEPYKYDVSLNYREAITTRSDFESLCNENTKSGPLFVGALGGSLLVVLGLALFNTYLSASYARLRFTNEIAEYRKIVDLEKEKLLSSY